jgi:hypothetical protein
MESVDILFVLCTIPLVTNDESPADIFEVAMFVTLQNSFVFE